MNAYIQSVIDTVKRRDNAKPEYIQCVEEVFSSLSPVIEQHPEYVEDDILTRMVEPDRLITFRVAWVDDDGKTRRKYIILEFTLGWNRKPPLYGPMDELNCTR